MSDTLLIRPATAADLDVLVGFAQAMAWETESKRLKPATLRRGVATVLEQPTRGRYLLAARADDAVGTLMLTYEWSDWRGADWWWIQSVYVAPAARRGGVFRALYAHVLAEAEQAAPAVCGLRLYVEHANHNAQATYAALGMDDAGYRMLERPLAWVADAVRKP